jgi:hypothetical protein
MIFKTIALGWIIFIVDTVAEVTVMPVPAAIFVAVVEEVFKQAYVLVPDAVGLTAIAPVVTAVVP